MLEELKKRLKLNEIKDVINRRVKETKKKRRKEMKRTTPLTGRRPW